MNCPFQRAFIFFDYVYVIRNTTRKRNSFFGISLQ